MSTELTTPIKIEIPGIGTIESADLYLKSEADKVIAEKDKEIAELEERIADGDKDFDMANSQNERLLKFVRHHKYKRCMAMAEMCDEVMMSCELRCFTVHRIWANKHEWSMRWKYRWLELAENFKEAK